MKKLLLGLGTLATIAAPIAAVVSCGASAPLYKRDVNKVMSDAAIESIVSTKGFTKIDLEDDPDQIVNLQSNIDDDIKNAKDVQTKSNIDEDDQEGIEEININKDLMSLNYNSQSQVIYYKNTITQKHVGASSYYDDHKYYQVNSLDYMVVSKNTNQILTFPSKLDPSVTTNKYEFSNFDSSIENLSLSKIEELDLLRTLNKNPNGMTKNGNGNPEKNIEKINEITKRIIYQSLDLEDALTNPSQMAQMSIQDQNVLDKASLGVTGGEEIIDRDRNLYLPGSRFIIVKWLPNKFQFDESIYDKDKDSQGAKGYNVLSQVKSLNCSLREVFSNQKDFNKKVGELFFKKFMSDDALNALISKFNLNKFDKDSNDKYTLDQRMTLINKFNHQNVLHFQGGTNNVQSWYGADGVDTYWSTISSHGIKASIDLYVSTDGTNNIGINGITATSPEEDTKGFKKAFDNGITAGTLNDISSLINLRQNHSNNTLLEHVLDSVVGIDTSFDIINIEKKTPSGGDNPQYLAYEKVKNSIRNRDERVVAFKEGTNKYSFLKVKRDSNDIKFDLDIYSDSEFDQKVKANKLNDILSSEFGNKIGFFEKLDSIFY